jgi:hypothetical protein
MRNAFVTIVVLAVFAAVAMAVDSFNPIADPKAIVRAGNARFTVLTDRLIRMEYSASAQFQDQPTWAFINRYLPVPSYTTSYDGAVLQIDTEYVSLRYLSTSETSFNSTNLQATIKFGGQSVMWNASHYADQVGNLFGTVRVRRCFRLSGVQPFYLIVRNCDRLSTASTVVSIWTALIRIVPICTARTV